MKLFSLTFQQNVKNNTNWSVEENCMVEYQLAVSDSHETFATKKKKNWKMPSVPCAAIRYRPAVPFRPATVIIQFININFSNKFTWKGRNYQRKCLNKYDNCFTFSTPLCAPFALRRWGRQKKKNANESNTLCCCFKYFVARVKQYSIWFA